jgi:polyphosphate kinase
MLFNLGFTKQRAEPTLLSRDAHAPWGTMARMSANPSRAETAPAVDDTEPRIVLPVPPAATPLPVDTDLPYDRYLNRELSWLDFNERVLALAEDPSQPLLERAKFLAIFASNLDEFFMVRVAGLKRRDEAGLSARSADGLTPREQLIRITARSQELAEQHARVFLDDVRPELEKHDIRIVGWSDLDAADRPRFSAYFSEKVFPVLTPLAVDPAHPFPYISGLSLSLAVTVRDPDNQTERFARVKVPNNVPRLIRVEADRAAGTATFLPLEELIEAHLDALFPGMEVREHHVFRVTRNAELDVEEDRDEDLLQVLERELARRRFGPPVRLELADTTSDHVLELLLRELQVDPNDVVWVPGLLDLSCLWQLYGMDVPELKDEPFVPATHPFAEGETPKNVFATLREGDVLVHHPYDSFSTSVQRFIEQAAEDENVLAIKQTLYRTSGDSPIVDALIDAAEAGKQVVALVELKARFDEQANIKWARALERVGVHVVYGLVGLKTHCKISLVVRQEGSTIRRYCHVGTGNYNPKTARLYEDIGLLTAEPAVGADVTELFNSLTAGYAKPRAYRRLLVAPHGIRRGIVQRIEAERQHAAADYPAGIRIKVNSLVDEQVIDALYRASQSGVPVDIVVRGICALKPGREGLSENIRVRSILGRFLEHSRVVHFVGGHEYWIGSADMMHRNLDRRVEAMVQVIEPRLTDQLDLMFKSALHPATRCWLLGPDGRWRPSPSPDELPDSTVRDHQLHMWRQRRDRQLLLTAKTQLVGEAD